MLDPYPGELEPGAEVWGINRAYMVEQRVSRVYFFDDVSAFSDGFVDDLNELDVPVFTRKPYSEIPRSVAYPIEGIVSHFGHGYFTCTAAYMAAHAIYEGYDRIICSGMYSVRDSLEYLSHASCMNFWLASAAAVGITVETVGDCGLMKAFPWESNFYGYERNLNAGLCLETLSEAYRQCGKYPKIFAKTAEYPEQRGLEYQEPDKCDGMKTPAIA